MPISPPDPEKDGLDHINIYSKGRTELGRWLSNFARTPFVCADGPFQSIEGYWYWLLAPDDRLRRLHGAEAKSFGRRLIGRDGSREGRVDSRFREKVRAALRIKLAGNDEMRQKLVASTLPLRHYYVYRGGVILPADADWLVKFFESYRAAPSRPLTLF